MKRLSRNEDGYTLRSYNGKAKKVVIPKHHFFKPVTAIGECAFADCENLTSIVISNIVTTIGRHAFSFCESLTSIEVDENNEQYKSIDGNLYTKDGKTLVRYAQGKKDKEFVIPNSVITIGEYAFHGCISLTSIVIPNSVTTIDEYAFADCKSLTSVVIPNSVTTIDEYAFAGCENLTSIEIPNSVTTIGMYAFVWCGNLISVEIPNSVTTIEKYAFKDCKNLTIYCEAQSQPTGWDEKWNLSGCPVVWGHKQGE